MIICWIKYKAKNFNESKQYNLIQHTSCSIYAKLFIYMMIDNNEDNENEMIFDKYKIDDNVENLIKNNILKITIPTIHTFVIYNNDGKWFLISSWIFLYKLTVQKIDNIRLFLYKIIEYFYLNIKDNEYEEFFMTYFFRKINKYNNAQYITISIPIIIAMLNEEEKKCWKKILLEQIINTNLKYTTICLVLTI